MDTEAVEYRVLCWTRRELSTRRAGAGGGRARGRAADGGRDRDFNRTPKEGVLQRGAVEYMMMFVSTGAVGYLALRRTWWLLSTGCCVVHGES